MHDTKKYILAYKKGDGASAGVWQQGWLVLDRDNLHQRKNIIWALQKTTQIKVLEHSTCLQRSLMGKGD